MNLKKLFEMKSKDLLYLGAIVVTMGVVLTNLLAVGSIGIVFIALGGLFFVMGLRKKKSEDEVKK